MHFHKFRIVRRKSGDSKADSLFSWKKQPSISTTELTNPFRLYQLSPYYYTLVSLHTGLIWLVLYWQHQRNKRNNTVTICCMILYTRWKRCFITFYIQDNIPRFLSYTIPSSTLHRTINGRASYKISRSRSLRSTIVSRSVFISSYDNIIGIRQVLV